MPRVENEKYTPPRCETRIKSGFDIDGPSLVIKDHMTTEDGHSVRGGVTIWIEGGDKFKITKDELPALAGLLLGLAGEVKTGSTTVTTINDRSFENWVRNGGAEMLSAAIKKEVKFSS